MAAYLETAPGYNQRETRDGSLATALDDFRIFSPTPGENFFVGAVHSLSPPDPCAASYLRSQREALQRAQEALRDEVRSRSTSRSYSDQGSPRNSQEDRRPTLEEIHEVATPRTSLSIESLLATTDIEAPWKGEGKHLQSPDTRNTDTESSPRSPNPPTFYIQSPDTRSPDVSPTKLAANTLRVPSSTSRRGSSRRRSSTSVSDVYRLSTDSFFSTGPRHPAHYFTSPEQSPPIADQPNFGSLNTIIQPPEPSGRQAFVVDLSVDPEHRYDSIAEQIMPVIDRELMEEVLQDLIEGSRMRAILAKVISKDHVHHLFRRVFTDEEQAELRGISRVTGLPLHDLVAFNVLLDQFGSTSGGMWFEDGSQLDSVEPFSGAAQCRTLGWDMDALRPLIIELHFKRWTGGPVIARSFGFFGHVGVLAGERHGLSMALNCRTSHAKTSLKERFRYRKHQIMVILGHRPSIASHLRHCLLSPPEEAVYPPKRCNTDPNPRRPPLWLFAPEVLIEEDIYRIIKGFSDSKSTSAYIFFATKKHILIMAKDNGFASFNVHGYRLWSIAEGVERGSAEDVTEEPITDEVESCSSEEIAEWETLLESIAEAEEGVGREIRAGSS